MKSAKWITAPRDFGSAVYTCKTSFAIGKPLKKATVKASAIGLYALFLNGKRVGKGVLAPGFTNYDYRVQYQTYDVTALLQKKNCLEIGVGQGWAVGYMGYAHTNHYYADHTSAILSISAIFPR